MGLVILFTFVLAFSCDGQPKVEKADISALDSALQKRLADVKGSVILTHSGVQSEFKGLEQSSKTEAQLPEVWKLLGYAKEKTLLEQMEKEKVVAIAIPSDIAKGQVPSGSVLESLLNSGELDQFSFLSVDSKKMVFAPTAKAYRQNLARLKNVIAYTRAKLAGSAEVTPLPRAFNEVLAEECTLDLRLTGSGGFNKKIGLVRGNGKSPALALDDAIAKAKDRFEKRGGGGFTATTLDGYMGEALVTLNFHREKAPVLLSGKKLLNAISLGLDGLEFEVPVAAKDGKKSGKTTTLLITPFKSKLYTPKSAEVLLQMAFEKANMDKSAWKGAGVKIRKFRTLDLTERTPGGEVIKLFRGAEYVDPAHLNRAAVNDAFRSGAEWLLNILDEEKRMFKYEYYATKDKYRKNRYNIIRHGLATLTLIQAYELYGEERFLKGGRLAIEWVLDMLEWEGKMAYFHHPKYDRKYKLGGAGVMVQAMCEYYRLKKVPEWEKAMKGLGEFMMHMQEENGHYRSFYNKPGQKRDDKEVTIYPGEASLALVRLYVIFKDKRFLDTVGDAFKYYSEWFNSSKSNRSKGNLGPFVPWDMSAMSEYWEVVKDDAVATYTYQMADWVIDNWYAWGDEDTYWKDYVGGFKGSKHKSNMPIWNSGVYGEGIASAYRLAALRGDTAKMEKYRKATHLTIRFIKNLQYRPGSVYYLPAPADATGAIPSSFHQDDCRLDYAYHCLTVNYRALRYFKDEDYKALGVIN